MDNIYTVAQPLCWLARALGVFPMSFEGPAANGKLKAKWHGFLLSILSLATIAFVTVRVLYVKEGPVSSSPWLSIVWIVESVLGVTLTLFQFLVQIFCFRSIPNFLATVHAFDLIVS